MALLASVASSAEVALNGIRVQYRCGEAGAQVNTVRFSVQVVNDSDVPLPLKDLSIRYWFTDELHKPLTYWCDWAKIGKEHVTGTFVTPEKSKASCLQIDFAAAAGDIPAGGSTGEIQCRFARNDWSNFDQGMAHSFDPAARQFVDHPKITLYRGGKLIWGREPGGAGVAAQAQTTSRLLPPARIPRPRGDAAQEARFLELWKGLHNPRNGYFSPDGIPYHSIETLIIEAPDYGHLTTSEAVSYWLWLEAKHGHLTGDFTPLSQAWEIIEKHIIPTAEDQPTAGAHNAAKPAQYAGEYEEPSKYPAALRPEVPVGADPIADELRRTYRTPGVYGMHWLIDLDNWYGYGRRDDAAARPSFINTFQRGAMESVWATVPHPAWEAFRFGGKNGFIDLFTGDRQYSQQWRYTSAPDADARAVQAMFWAYEWAAQHGAVDKVPVEKAARLGDYLRYGLFDKYFKKLGCASPQSDAGRGYDSAHYLLAWYYGWGGSIDTSGAWAWRIGSSHCHSGYQNPLAAWALAEHEALKPASPNAPRDWRASLKRQIEFYRWLQSADGAIAGGATNSVNGRYDPPLAGAATFYGMTYDWQPVYHDPPSNNWFGMQTWTMGRVAEYYYVTGDVAARQLLAKWVAWAMQNVKFTADGAYLVPQNLRWNGQPDTWIPAAPSTNKNLRVEVVDHSPDIGVAASLARTLLYYAAGQKRHDKPDPKAANMAMEILSRMWTKYRDEKGLACPEPRADYARIFEQAIFIPPGWTGRMANGDAIKPGVKFLDIRSRYRQDPAFPAAEKAYRAGAAPVFRYHRFWAQVEAALAYAAAAELDTGQ